MYTVKKLQPATELERIELGNNRRVIELTPNSITFGIVDENGKVHSEINLLGQKMFSTFSRKYIAQEICNMINEKAGA